MQFSEANTKLQKLEKVLGKRVYSFDLLSGKYCYGAVDCRAYADYSSGNGRVIDLDCKFRCYSASQEALYKNTFLYRERNTNAVFSALERGTLAKEILESIPKRAQVIRVHSAGDFLSAKHVESWYKVAEIRKDLVFYCYTKMIPLFKKVFPDNFRVNLSYGSKWDNAIESVAREYGHGTVKVVYNENCGLPIDRTDEIAYHGHTNFALLIHGTQPKK